MYTILIFSILLFSFSVNAVSDDVQELLDNLHRECVSQTGVAEDLITNAKNGDFSEDPNLKCYMKCIFEEIGTIDDDGKIDEDGMIAMMPDEVKNQASATIKGCGTKIGSDLCDSMWLTNKCYYASNPTNYFLP